MNIAHGLMKSVRLWNMSRAGSLLLLCVTLMGPDDASADLILSNSGFEDGSGSTTQGADVPAPWFDNTTVGSPGQYHTYGAWQIGETVASNPFDTDVVGLTGGGSTNAWVYQAIGTRAAGDLSLTIGFDLGSFIGATAARSGNMTVSIYQSATFTGANNNNIALSGSATLVDSAVVASGPLTGGQIQSYSTTLDISGANTSDNLFLHCRWNGTVGVGDNNGYMAADNVTMSVVPEPAMTGLLLIGGALLLRARRRRG